MVKAVGEVPLYLIIDAESLLSRMRKVVSPDATESRIIFARL